MKRILLALALLLVLPVSGLAENIGLNDVIETLEKPFRSDTPANQAIHDFEAEFFQLSKLAALDREQRGQGRVQIRFLRQSGGRVPLVQFRWEYDQPNNQEIVSDGKTLWVYMPENNQVIQSDIEQTRRAGSEDPLTFLTGLGNLSQDFSIGWAEPQTDRDGNYILQLRPRRISGLIRDLQIVVDRDAVLDLVRNNETGQRLPLLASTVTDPNDNTTHIEFSRPWVNRGMSDMTFEFMVPAGVDVVRPSGQQMGY